MADPIKAVQRDLDKLRKRVLKLSDNFDRLREEIDSEIHDIKKETTPLFDKNIELDRRTKALEKANAKMNTNMSGLADATGKINKRVSALVAAWNPEVLKSMVSGMDSFSKALKSLEKRSAATLKNLNKTNAGVVAIANHAGDIEAEHTDAKFAAKELSEKSDNLNDTVKQFFQQTDAVNSKLTANASILDDLTSAIELMKDRLNATEEKAATISEVRALLEENSRMLSQLAQRLAYLEKISVKTIVLD